MRAPRSPASARRRAATGRLTVADLFVPERLETAFSNALARAGVQRRLSDFRVERCWPSDSEALRLEWSFSTGGRRYHAHGVPNGRSEDRPALEPDFSRDGLRGFQIHLPEVGLLVHSPDCDPRMPHLADCLDSTQVATVFGWAKANAPAIKLLAYKAGRRASLLVRPGRARQGWLVGKTFRDERGRSLIARHSAVRQQLQNIDPEVTTCKAHDFIAGLRMAVLEWAEGTSLDGGRALGASSAKRAMKTLAALHRVVLDDLKEFSVDDECHTVRRWHAALGHKDKRLADQARRYLERLICVGDSIPPPRTPCTIHRDFYEKQLLVTRDTSTILDLDTLTRGDPAQDVGNFLAHWLLKLFQARNTPPDPMEMCEMLVRAYRRHGGEIEPRSVVFYCAASLIRGGALHAFRTLTCAQTPALWRAAQELLDELERRPAAATDPPQRRAGRPSRPERMAALERAACAAQSRSQTADRI